MELVVVVVVVDAVIVLDDRVWDAITVVDSRKHWLVWSCQFMSLVNVTSASSKVFEDVMHFMVWELYSIDLQFSAHLF